jgi:hypothetical protein
MAVAASQGAVLRAADSPEAVATPVEEEGALVVDTVAAIGSHFDPHSTKENAVPFPGRRSFFSTRFLVNSLRRLSSSPAQP